MQLLLPIQVFCRVALFFGIFPINLINGKFTQNAKLIVPSFAVLLVLNAGQIRRCMLAFNVNTLMTGDVVMQLISEALLQLCALSLIPLLLRSNKLADIMEQLNLIFKVLEMDSYRKNINRELLIICCLPALAGVYVAQDIFYSPLDRVLPFIMEIMALSFVSSLYCMLCCGLKYTYVRLGDHLERSIRCTSSGDLQLARNIFQSATTLQEIVNNHFSSVNLFFLVLQNVYLQQDIYYIVTLLCRMSNCCATVGAEIDAESILLFHLWLVYDAVRALAYFWHCTRTHSEVCFFTILKMLDLFIELFVVPENW
jgi:hypothetical protein